jgi:putative transposase
VKPLSDRRLLIEPEHINQSVVKQFELFEVSRSGFYYEPVPETEENLAIMLVLDEQYLKTPFFGTEKLVVLLILMGYKINKKSLRRLIKIKGWETLYFAPRTTKIDPTA